MIKLYAWSNSVSKFVKIKKIILTYNKYNKILSPKNFDLLKINRYNCKVYSNTFKDYVPINKFIVHYKVNKRFAIKNIPTNKVFLYLRKEII